MQFIGETLEALVCRTGGRQFKFGKKSKHIQLTVINRGLSPVRLPKALVAFGGHLSSYWAKTKHQKRTK